MTGLLLDHEWLLQFGFIGTFCGSKRRGYLGFGRQYFLLLLRLLLVLIP